MIKNQKKRNWLSLVLTVVVGGLAIHGAMIACSGKGARDAGAQTTGGSCQQWAFVQISTADVDSMSPGPIFPVSTSMSRQSLLAPAGWEPVGYSTYGSSPTYLFRYCAQ